MSTMEPSRQQGSATLELVLIAPALVALALLVGVVSSISGARGDIDDAAWEAARAASLTRTVSDARAAASDAVNGRLAGRRWGCLDRAVTLDESRFVPGGAAAVTLTCHVRLADGLLPIPGVVGLRARSAQPLERYRGMQ